MYELFSAVAHFSSSWLIVRDSADQRAHPNFRISPMSTRYWRWDGCRFLPPPFYLETVWSRTRPFLPPRRPSPPMADVGFVSDSRHRLKALAPSSWAGSDGVSARPSASAGRDGRQVGQARRRCQRLEGGTGHRQPPRSRRGALQTFQHQPDHGSLPRALLGFPRISFGSLFSDAEPLFELGRPVRITQPVTLGSWLVLIYRKPVKGISFHTFSSSRV